MPLINLLPCIKNCTRDLDKAISPEETLTRVLRRLKEANLDILAENRRVDNGRLGIPVYLAMCGSDAKSVMPVRKQMGKGASPAQAQASALMELLERFSFFSFWKNKPHVVSATWSEAEKLFGSRLMPLKDIIASVNDTISCEQARRMLDLLAWDFYPATCLNENREAWLPIDWFRMLGEFNGSASGNTMEEAILQALCELVERHVSAVASETHPELPTIRVIPGQNAVLDNLLAAFKKNGIHLLMKDMTLDLPVPTVAAFAWDSNTFPTKSELVFTAGTATSPAKAVIRALTEVAQLAGDFCTGSVYEASGLEKYRTLQDAAWLFSGREKSLQELPDISSSDIRDEVVEVVRGLTPALTYAVPLTLPDLAIPAVWCIVPGLKFRERDKSSCVGLFIGRRLVEQADPQIAATGLAVIRNIYGERHFLTFFEGMLAFNSGELKKAAVLFGQASAMSPETDSAALAAFYAGYALMQAQDWLAAKPYLEEALRLEPEMKEAANLLGTGYYQAGEFQLAEAMFDSALRIDKGSAVDLANRGICRKHLGKIEEAKRDLQTALDLDATMGFAVRHLRELMEA